MISICGQQNIMELRKPKEKGLNSGRALLTDVKKSNLSLRYLLRYLFGNLGKIDVKNDPPKIWKSLKQTHNLN